MRFALPTERQQTGAHGVTGPKSDTTVFGLCSLGRAGVAFSKAALNAFPLAMLGKRRFKALYPADFVRFSTQDAPFFLCLTEVRCCAGGAVASATALAGLDRCDFLSTLKIISFGGDPRPTRCPPPYCSNLGHSPLSTVLPPPHGLATTRCPRTPALASCTRSCGCCITKRSPCWP